ncbi:MAG: nickel pincer cofactor biosynthesis protein LarB [Pirellulaceae bacterium]
MQSIHEILQAVAAGHLSILDGEKALASQQLESIDGATLDYGRAARCGYGEVVYGEGKSADLIDRILEKLLARSESVLVTRLASDVLDAMNLSDRHFHYEPAARTLRVARVAESLLPVHEATSTIRPVVVITAGSTDEYIAQEVVETLIWMRIPVRRLTDVGVAGPQRLLTKLPALRHCAAAVVAAGMEGALPSVVAGHVPYPVIAVPTSVGYGASMGGIAALLSMLTSCASNVAVVNIDAGFKAGYLAGLIATPPRATTSQDQLKNITAK